MQMPSSSHTLVFSRTQQKSDEYKQRRPWSKKQFLKTKVENCVDNCVWLFYFFTFGFQLLQRVGANYHFTLFHLIQKCVSQMMHFLVTEVFNKLPLHTFPFYSKVCLQDLSKLGTTFMATLCILVLEL